MLLSLLSKRSLEVDSRDSYGFALRPQHAQRYREYTFIYKKEEEERSDKWRKFLEQRAKSSQPCSSNNEHKEGEDSSGRNSAEDAETKGEISVDKDCDGGDSSGSHLVESAEAKEGKIDERVSEGDNSNDRKPLEGTNINEGKSKVQTWTEIRPSLNAIDKMMSFRVKTGRNMKGQQMNATSDHLPSVVESEPLEGISEEDTEQRVCINETSDDGIDTPENSIGDQHSLELFSPRKELESLVQGGVPKDLRGEVWQAFVGVKTRRVESYYEDLLAQETNSSESKDQDVPSGEFGKWRKQIEKDIPRTFPGHPALDENGRNSLRRLLLAYARHNPSVGYCQAMNFFAGLLLLLMPEENAFWAFVGIIDDYFEGYYTEEMIESQVDQLVFEELMRERFPKLVNHLDYLGVQVTWISGPWFLSIFVNMIPWESVLRVWDVMLFEGNRIMLFRTALALMELYGPALVATKDAGDAITLLQSLVGSTFDSSQLVFTACMGFLAVTEARLQEMREKHRPSVLVVVEERSKKGRALKDSKVVATKLYSFKHDRGSVVDEKKTTKGSDKVTDEDKLHSESHSSNLDESLRTLNVDSELGSLTDLRDQVVWLKVELCRTLEQKRSAELRAEELETALMEIVKQDNGHQLSARVEQLEQEVAELQQDLADKEEQEAAMLQVLLKVEQDHRVAEDLRRRAEQEVTAQKSAIQTLQEKYDKAMASIYEMEKRVVVAESMLEATLQYESGQSKALSSPRAGRVQSPKVDNPTRKIGLLTFGLGWRDRNKGKPANVDDFGESKPNTPRMENVITPRKESDDRDHDR